MITYLKLPWTRDGITNTLCANSPFGRVAVTKSEGIYFPTWGELVDLSRPCSSEENVKWRVEVAVSGMLHDVTRESGFTIIEHKVDGSYLMYARGSKKIEIMDSNSEDGLIYNLVIPSDDADIIVTLTDSNSLEDALAKYCPRDGSDNSEQKQPINI
jgi:hypothetical protein